MFRIGRDTGRHVLKGPTECISRIGTLRLSRSIFREKYSQLTFILLYLSASPTSLSHHLSLQSCTHSNISPLNIAPVTPSNLPISLAPYIHCMFQWTIIEFCLFIKFSLPVVRLAPKPSYVLMVLYIYIDKH